MRLAQNWRIRFCVSEKMDGSSPLSWLSDSTTNIQATLSQKRDASSMGRWMERLDVEGKVRINGERLVTDGMTSVDGCFNFSLPSLHLAFVINQAIEQKLSCFSTQSAHNFLVLMFLLLAS